MRLQPEAAEIENLKRASKATLWRAKAWTAAWTMFVAVLVWLVADPSAPFDVSALGSFMSGAVAGYAFIWLVAGLYMQQHELKLNTFEMGQLVEHAEAQARAADSALRLQMEQWRYTTEPAFHFRYVPAKNSHLAKVQWEVLTRDAYSLQIDCLTVPPPMHPASVSRSRASPGKLEQFDLHGQHDDLRIGVMFRANGQLRSRIYTLSRPFNGHREFIEEDTTPPT